MEDIQSFGTLDHFQPAFALEPTTLVLGVPLRWTPLRSYDHCESVTSDESFQLSLVKDVAALGSRIGTYWNPGITIWEIWNPSMKLKTCSLPKISSWAQMVGFQQQENQRPTMTSMDLGDCWWLLVLWGWSHLKTIFLDAVLENAMVLKICLCGVAYTITRFKIPQNEGSAPSFEFSLLFRRTKT